MEICIAFAKDFPVLCALRYGLGFAQAAVSPAFIILTSNWYRQQEHPMRVATWISMNGISQIVGGILMYALGDADMAISSWRVMFLIFGGLTVLFGILFTVMIPEKTTTAWFLNQRERHVATKRLAIDRASGARKGFDIRQLRETLSTPLSLLYFLMAFCIASTNPITKVISLYLLSTWLNRANDICTVFLDSYRRSWVLRVRYDACWSSDRPTQFHHLLDFSSYTSFLPQYPYIYSYRSNLYTPGRLHNAFCSFGCQRC